MSSKPFLERTAGYIFGHYGDRTGSVCVVLPSRRACLFLKKYLASMTGKPVWAPGIFSIEDFLVDLTGYRTVDPLDLQFDLYAVYRETAGAEARDFNEFMKWAPILLQDFDEIDSYLADPAALFHHLDAIKAMTVWNLDQAPLTPSQLEYIEFFRSLLGLYEGLKDRLMSKKALYKGLIFRVAAERSGELAASPDWQQVVFAGFNALSPAEEKLFAAFSGQGKAKFLWDCDHYYIDDPVQEAGSFIRKHLARLDPGDHLWVDDDLATTAKQIRIIGVPKMAGQARAAGEIVEELLRESPDGDDTVIVPADEGLLIPMLGSLPPGLESFNITMGFPLRLTHAFVLFDSFLALFEGSFSYAKNREPAAPHFYHKDLIRILANPVMDGLLRTAPPFPGDPGRVVAGIRKSNLVFLTMEELENGWLHVAGAAPGLLHGLLDADPNDPAQCLEKLSLLARLLRDHYLSRDADPDRPPGLRDRLDLEYTYQLSLVIARLRDMLGKHDWIKDIRMLRILFNQLGRTLTVPFQGEPLRGLQVMGLLETRSVDFRNVILLSANEDVLPGKGQPHSFITYDLRQQFGLPTRQTRQAVFAYHFYRLIQRAEKVFITYNTEADELGGGEKSRFISQLQQELPARNPDISITEAMLVTAPLKPVVHAITVDKTPRVCEKLAALAGKGLSPSSLGAYIQCSLRFYLQEVAGIKPPEEVEETMDAATFGNAVHEVLKNLFEPYVGKPLKPESLLSADENITTLAEDAFAKCYGRGPIRYGKNLILLNVAQALVRNLVREEIAFLKELSGNDRALHILHLEKDLSCTMDLEAGNSIARTVKLKGICDRIDLEGSLIRIIDYKTTSLKPREKLAIRDLDSLIRDPRLAKAFQVLFYAYLFAENNQGRVKELQAGICFLKTPSKRVMPVSIADQSEYNPGHLAGYRRVLSELLQEIYDPAMAFMQTKDTDVCAYCDYKAICNR
jgi:CRISPR/Cas system-associated exonuclease Cas4 (RecB family)